MRPDRRLVTGGILVLLWAGSVTGAWIAGARAAAGRAQRHDPGSPRIVVSAELREALAADHERATGQEPAPDEIDALVESYVDREVLYREALALGLDEDDLIVRRRMMQKMEALLDTLAVVEDPTVEDLRARRDRHPERYREAERIAFRHVFLADREDLGRAERLLGELDQGADPAPLGDPFIRGRVFAARPVEGIAGIFGSGFAERLGALPVGRWSGPVPSSYGLHLVHVDARMPERDPPLEELAARLTSEIVEERRTQARDELLAEMRERYTVELER